MNGARVGITAARRALEQAALVRSLGGIPVLGASLVADAPKPAAVVVPSIVEVLGAPIDVAVFLTGVGARLVVSVADEAGLGPALRSRLSGAWVVARGPKPRAVLRELGIRIDWVADPPHAPVIAARLEARGTGGKRIFVQGYGQVVGEDLNLAGSGATVISTSPYAAAVPGDTLPALRLAREAKSGELDALTFTSAQAAVQFVEIAERGGVDVSAIRAGGALISAVGPVTRAALVAHGLTVDCEPEVPRMGAMYRALALRIARGPLDEHPNDARANLRAFL
ncbi:MAG: uroporphyrinogen-III synthase [Actinobacteria bacterium]|nr:uroporphyrinogen-III synthase [Actinomycetota bacterium]